MAEEFTRFQGILHRALTTIKVKPAVASRFCRGKTEEELTGRPSTISWIRAFFEERVSQNAKTYGITLSDNTSPRTVLLLADVDPRIANDASFEVTLEKGESLDLVGRIETWARSQAEFESIEKEWMQTLQEITTPGSFRPLNRAQGKSPLRMGFGSF